MARPPKYKTPEDMEKAIDSYFDEEGGHTITGLALYLGFVDRQSLYDYEKKEEFSCTIKRARLRVEHEYEKQLFTSSPTGGIFGLKNMGWRDKQDIEHSGMVTHEHITANEARHKVKERLARLLDGRRDNGVVSGNGRH